MRSAPIHSADCAFYCLLKHAGLNKELLCRTLAAAWQRLLAGVASDSISRTGVVVDQQHFGNIGHALRAFCTKYRNIQSRRLLWAHDATKARLISNLRKSGPELPDEPAGINSDDMHIIEASAMEADMTDKIFKLLSKIYSQQGDKFVLIENLKRLSHLTWL